MIIKRILSAWIISAISVIIIISGSFKIKTYASSFNIFIYILIVAGIFFVITAIKFLLNKRKHNFCVDDYILAFAIIIYAFMLVNILNDFYFYIGVMTVITISGIYFLSGDKLNFSKIKLSVKGAIIIVSAAGLLCAFFIGYLTVLRYITYSSPNFDFGIFVNMFYNMKKTFLPNVSCERDLFNSHFAVHISPIYYLILPFYMLFPFPQTLQIAQAVIVASAVIPLFLISKKYNLSPKLICGVCIAFCAYPALSGGCFYDLHENCFLVPLLLWLFYFNDCNKKILIYISALLVLFVKEDSAVYLAFFAIFIITAQKKYKRGLILLISSIIYFLLTSWILNTFGVGIMDIRFINYITNQGGLPSMLKNIFRNPALVIYEIFHEEKILYMLQMFIPLGFLPFVTKKIPRYILLLPMVLINLMPDYKYQHTLYYQYNFGVIAFLFYASVLNISDLKSGFKRSFIAFITVSSLLMFNSTVLDKWYYTGKYKDTLYEIKMLDKSLSKIPKNASLQASTYLLPHVADRFKIYEIGSRHKTEYIAIDLRFEEDENYSDFVLELYKNDGYVEYMHEEYVIIILYNPDWIPD